jgi:hypothetical protein
VQSRGQDTLGSSAKCGFFFTFGWLRPEAGRWKLLTASHPHGGTHTNGPIQNRREPEKSPGAADLESLWSSACSLPI